MTIDKSDFVSFLSEYGSDISVGGSSFKGIFVPLQSSKQLLDVKLNPGDAIVYADPAESLTLGELLSFQGKSFLLVSNSKIQYINGNPIYLELGLERFLPVLNLQSGYNIRTCISRLLSSTYNIAHSIFSKSVPASFDILTATAPGQVTGLRAEYNAPETISLYWNALDPDSFDHYEIHRSTSTGFTPSSSTLVGISASNLFANRDLESDVTYYFKICAVNDAGNKGAYSSQVSETTSGV